MLGGWRENQNTVVGVETVVGLSVPLSLLELMKNNSDEVLISTYARCGYSLGAQFILPSSFIPHPNPLYVYYLPVGLHVCTGANCGPCVLRWLTRPGWAVVWVGIANGGNGAGGCANGSFFPGEQMGAQRSISMLDYILINFDQVFWDISWQQIKSNFIWFFLLLFFFPGEVPC